MPSNAKQADSEKDRPRDGRRWLGEASEYSTIFNAAQRGALDRLVEAANPFFDSIDALAAQAAVATKAGRPRTPFGLTAFLDRMIGIAKQAKVLPSTPMRARFNSLNPIQKVKH
jgi:hypothetical protein